MNIDILKSLQNILIPYDSICPRNCDLCEEYETAIFLPNEDKLVTDHYESFKHFIKHEEGFHYVDMTIDCPFFVKNNNMSQCSIYRQRPIDCRIFPFYPFFNVEDNSYILLRSEEYCPLSREKLTMMENDVKTVIDVISKQASKSWKETYNLLNLHHSNLEPFRQILKLTKHNI
jgi:Fe-S-cluster containining protein